MWEMNPSERRIYLHEKSIGKVRFDGLPKLEDIREMSEEQFVEAFEMLRDRTRDWIEFSPEILIEESRHLFVVRCVLGLSQRDFAKKVGFDRGTVRGIEAGRSKFVHLGPAKRWSSKISGLIRETRPSIETGLAKLIEFRRCRMGHKFEKVSKPITKISEEDLLELFQETRKLTKGFTEFSPRILMKFPRFLLIFRLLLGFSHDKFGKVLEVHERSVRSREKGMESIGRNLASRLAIKIGELFEVQKPATDFESVLHRFKLFKLFLHDGIEGDVERGLIFAKKQHPSEIEQDIIEILKSHSIEFTLHPVIQGLKKKLCLDFAVPSDVKPKFVIEAFSFRLDKPLGQVLKRVRETDHRFRMIKLKEADIKCLLCIKFTGKDIPTKRIKEFIGLELIDTDFLLVSEEIRSIDEILKT